MEEKNLSLGPFVIFNLFPRLTSLGHKSQIMEGLILRPFSYTLNQYTYILAKYLFKLLNIAYLGYLCLKYHTYCDFHYLIKWCASQVQYIFFATSQFDWPISPSLINKKKLWRLPKKEGFTLKYKFPLLLAQLVSHTNIVMSGSLKF
jgi:hypothetical protein